jgi:hypothetical protein
MTPSQLRQWSIQNSQPDQWWLCLDGVTEEVPVSVAEIESLLASGDYAQAQALHTSHAETDNPAWIRLTVPATFMPPPSVDTAMAALSQSEKAQNAPTIPKANTPNKDIQQGCLALIGLLAFLFVIFKGFAWLIGAQSSDDDVSTRRVNDSGISSANLSGEYTITGDNFTGFSNREDEDRASELASDEEAFSKFFLACVMAKRATLFKKGETVILEEFGGFADSKVKLRRKGELVGYWTNREAID